MLLAALSVLLYRYSQREDICIGIPVAGRRLVETEALIGLFVNTLVIRTDLSGNKRFRDLLAEVRETSLEAYSNQDMPFERVVEELQPKRNLAHNPIFQVMMTALKEPLRDRSAGALTASRYLPGSSSSLFDLSVFFIEAADGSFWWRFQYGTALFDAARIKRMIGHYETLLNGILQNPDLRIGDMPLLTEAELEQLSRWNGPVAAYPKTCVHELIAEQVARSPNRIAVVFGAQRLTYAELHQQSLRVAAALRAAGAGSGSTVAILLDRSLEMIVGVLGVLHSGAAYVPLDLADPPDRVAFKLGEAGTRLVLTQGFQVGRLPTDSRQHTLIEDAMTTPPWNAVESQDPESPAYVIFTSGSTGKPKGVCVPHRALANLLASVQRRPGLTESDIFLAVTSLSFDISALELFLPLVTGARLVIAAKETAADGSKLLDSIRHNAVTTMQATPSTWRMLIEAGWSGSDCDLKVWCGGEALPTGLADELSKRSDSVWNLYGPTETTVWSSVGRVGEHRPVTIGSPIRNTQFYVLDRRMRRVPIGVAGELYIGGDGLSKGYLGRQELSREKFVPNPFESSGGKLYRTGDEVRRRDDGEIEYLGRLDFQVKVRGHRIELGEVEYCAGQCPGVKQAVAMVRNDSGGDQRLMCYVVLERGATLSPAELRASIKGKLPSFMVPVVVIVESLPLTENGKIDLARLPEPAEEETITGEPRDDLERRLLDIWKRVLGINRIGITDNFFDLGGHSLLAMRLLAEIDAVFSQHLPVATVFRAQTVEQMAAILGQRVAKPPSPVMTLQLRGDGPPLFLVPGAHHNPLLYADLARLLGFEQPVHLLQYTAFENNREPLERIEAIAEHFIGEIRKVQPRGPYRLAGFCLGGIVAFEMAQQLIASGEEPPLLALAEAWHPTSVPLVKGAPFRLRPWIFFGRGLVRHVSTALQFSPRDAFQYVRQKSSIIREMILRHDVYRGDRYKRYQDLIVEATYRAASRYVPTGYPGRISLFFASNLEVKANSDTRLCWRDFARKGSVVIRMDARDLSEILRRPHVEAIADNLSQQMRQMANSDVNSSVYGLVS